MKKIDFHYTTLLFLFLSIIAGMFKDMIILFSIIIIHELGHIITSLLFKYNIHKIHIYPYGGMIEYISDINKPIIEDFVVAVSGVIMQSIYYFIIYYLYSNYYISEKLFIIFCNYHFGILLFNLIPIYPLDGSKVLNLLINKILPFKLSHIISIIVSIILIIIFLIFNYDNTNVILISTLLLHRTIVELKNHKFIFNKFLLERYINNYNYNKYKYINGYKLNRMYRDYKHIFFIKNRRITEKNALKLRFKIDI